MWPWVAQIGQDRAGFYSYEILENLVGCKMKNLDDLIPALQHWQGTSSGCIPGPGRRLGQAPLARHDPGHALVFYTRRPGTALTDPPDGTWAFVVEPVERRRRASSCAAADADAGPLGASFERGIFEPIHFAMERKMMEGIKLRAEDRPVSTARDDVQVSLWVLTFAFFIASGIFTLEGRGWRWHAVTFTAAGLLFGVLTLVQPSVTGSAAGRAARAGDRGARSARLRRAVKVDVVARDTGPGQRAERPGQSHAVPPGGGLHDLPRLGSQGVL